VSIGQLAELAKELKGSVSGFKIAEAEAAGAMTAPPISTSDAFLVKARSTTPSSVPKRRCARSPRTARMCAAQGQPITPAPGTRRAFDRRLEGITRVSEELEGLLAGIEKEASLRKTEISADRARPRRNSHLPRPADAGNSNQPLRLYPLYATWSRSRRSGRSHRSLLPGFVFPSAQARPDPVP